MNQPTIIYYARFDYDKSSRKIPKYVVTAASGYYAPFERLKGNDGRVAVYLQEKIKDKAAAPGMRLQAKGSFNLSGLKDYFVDGKLSGYAYGYPPDGEVYGGKKQRPNPFYLTDDKGGSHTDDCFLFIVHQDDTANTETERVRPSSIELVVLAGAKILAASYVKQMMMGGFDNELTKLRELSEM